MPNNEWIKRHHLNGERWITRSNLKIEITPEMIEAGAHELFRYDYRRDNPDNTALEIYKAMELVR